MKDKILIVENISKELRNKLELIKIQLPTKKEFDLMLKNLK